MISDAPALASRTTISSIGTCHLARALTGAEQAALKVELDCDGMAVRKCFNLSEGL